MLQGKAKLRYLLTRPPNIATTKGWTRTSLGALKVGATASFKLGNSQPTGRRQTNYFTFSKIISTGKESKDYYRQGKHVKTETIITQESVQARLRSALRDMNDHDQHPLRFQTSLNDPDRQLKEFGSSRSKVSVRTAEMWLKILGFMPTTSSKGWFTDGHEREDVVQHRTEFLVVIERLEIRTRHWSGPRWINCTYQSW